jgi:hypothetical protein
MSKSDRLAVQRILIDALVARLNRDVGVIERFPTDMDEQAEWRTILHEDIAELEREMCTYKYLEEKNDDDT